MRRLALIIVVCGLPACSYRQELGTFADGGIDAAAMPDANVVHDAPVLQTDVLVRDGAVVYRDGGLPYRACTQLPPTEPTGDVVAVWSGYLEDPLPGGSDALTITLRSAGDGSLTGTVVPGVGPVPPAPATSDDCYPSAWNWSGGMEPSGPVVGFAYPITSATATTLRLQVSFAGAAPWADWCACQVPVEVVPGNTGSWACMPNAGSHGQMGDPVCYLDDGSNAAFPWCKIPLCQHFPVCTCTESACSYDATTTTSIDLSVNGDRADGQSPWSSGAMHLQRTQ